MKRAVAALALTALAGTACRSRDRSAGGHETAPAPATETGEPLVVAAEHAILGATWRPGGHLLVLTPSELVDVDPDAPYPATRLPLLHARRLHASAAGAVVIETRDGWESRDATTLTTLAHGDGHEQLTLSADGRWLVSHDCQPDDGGRACRFVVADVDTGQSRASVPAGHEGGDGAFFAFVPGGVPETAWATVTMGGELTVVDALTGQVHLRRKLRRLGEDGSSRELFELRGKRVYLTSAYGFEVVDLARDVTLVRLKDEHPLDEVGFAVSDDGLTVTETGSFAETFVETWDVPPGANARRISTPSVAGEATSATSPDGRFFASWDRGSLRLVSLRSGALVLQLGPGSDPPVDMFRQLIIAGSVPRLRDRKGGEIVLSTDDPPLVDAAVADAPDASDGLMLAAQDDRFLYFLGTEHEDSPTTALLPVRRIDRRTGAALPIFAARRSAIAAWPDHTVTIFGDEDEARRSIVCATATRWYAAERCLNVFTR